MKYFSKITLGLILCAGFVSSCKDDDEVGIDGITIDKEEITELFMDVFKLYNFFISL